MNIKSTTLLVVSLVSSYAVANEEVQTTESAIEISTTAEAVAPVTKKVAVEAEEATPAVEASTTEAATEEVVSAN